MLDYASSDGSRRQTRARDLDQSLHCGGDEGSVGVVAHLPVDVLGNDENEAAPLKGEVDARDTHGNNFMLFEVSRDKLLCLGLSNPYRVTELDPYVADVVGIRPPVCVERDSHTVDVDVGFLMGT